MGYKKRIWYPGVSLHVMSRGVRGSRIFNKNADYVRFLSLLGKYQKEYEYVIHSYCLMPNHFHLQMTTGDVSISKIMERILKDYSEYFNLKYGFKGHVFQGRFKSVEIMDDKYFIELSRYIHLNPVKAGIVEKPENYEYCSYRYYVKNYNNPILYKDWTLGYFKDNNAKLYEEFVKDRMNHFKYEEKIMKDINDYADWD